MMTLYERYYHLSGRVKYDMDPLDPSPKIHLRQPAGRMNYKLFYRNEMK
jgi:hypothetical protein